MANQLIYFNDPDDILKIKSQIGTVYNQVTTGSLVFSTGASIISSASNIINIQGVANIDSVQMNIFTGGTGVLNSIQADRSAFRKVDVLDSLVLSTGTVISSKSDIITVTGTLSGDKIQVNSIYSGIMSGGNMTANVVKAEYMTGGIINQVKRMTDSQQLYEESVDKIVCITIRTQSGAYYVGSGFFVTGPNMNTYGYILTASHVIGDPDISGIPVCNNIWINTTYPRNAIYQINGSTNVVMGYDKISDVALLRISGTGFNKVFEYADSRSQCKIGSIINTIGYPGGVDNQSISRGIVRDNKSQLEGYVMESVITDISIYGGNSGGPMITEDGKAIGIVSYGYTNEEEINGGVASYLFKPIVNYYLQNYSTGVVSYPKGYLGIRYNSVSLPVAVIYGMSKVEGYYVQGLDGTIVPAKFSQNDVITEVEGVRVGVMNDQYPLFTEIQLRPPGSVISVKYRPSGAWSTELTKSVTLSPFNPANDYLFSNYRRQPVKIEIV